MARLADTANGALKEILYVSGGTYNPTPVILKTGLTEPWSVAFDATGNLFTATSQRQGTLQEIPFSNDAHGTPQTVASGFHNPRGLTLDAAGDVFVADYQNDTIKEVPLSQGSYGTPVQLGSGIENGYGVAVDSLGRVYAVDENEIWMFTP